MKELICKKIAERNLSAVSLPALLDEEKIAFHTIDTVNWSQYPYCPDVSFRMAYTDCALLLHYKVREESVRAVAAHDNGSVWEDACVEFFSVPANDGVYYNIECNCAGTLLIATGSTREERQRAPQEVLNKVQRWSSLGRAAFEERVGECSWEVALIIPFSTFFKHRITSMAGKNIRANFYKCGDKLPTPHFLSWNPIELPNPDFHCPPFFGSVTFEKG